VERRRRPPGRAVPAPGTPVEPGALYSAGAEHRVPAAGAHLVLSVWKYQPLPDEPTVAQECVFEGRVSGAAPYQQPCAGKAVTPFVTGNAATGQAGPTPLGSYVTSYGVTLEFRPETSGTWSVGAFSNSAGPSEDPHLAELWIDY
jgi:hypothetical protein